jgi:Uncharacterised nucleotidyltransferase
LPSLPFAADFLRHDWPLLLECCSLPRHPANIAELAGERNDQQSLLGLAETHGVIGHLAAALADVPGLRSSTAFLASLRARQRVHVLSTLAMTAELFRILKLFRQSGIECAVVKGPVLALRAYGDPAVRQYADLDLLVRNSDIARAAEIFLAAGYQSRVPAAAIRAGKVPGEYVFRGPETKIIFELHTERTLRYFPLPLPIDDYFQRRTSLLLDGHAVPALSAEDDFILISVHGATHFWERLMWICDVAAMVQNHAELDWKRIRQSAAKVGAARMVRLALLLAERMLRVPVPAEMNREVAGDSACARLAQQIESWLPYGGYAAPTIVQRAKFRFRMRGGAFAGAAYLARLTFATTEEDWSADAGATPYRLGEILRRPVRLAKKYRRNPHS